MRAAVRQQLDPTIRSNDTRDFHGSLSSKIVGQEEGVQALVDMFQVFCAGLNSPGRPVGNLDRKSTRLNSSHEFVSRMPSSA